MVEWLVLNIYSTRATDNNPEVHPPCRVVVVDDGVVARTTPEAR